MVKTIGESVMLREYRDFEIDEHNSKVLRFLIYYFNGCHLCESVFPDEGYKAHKQLLLIGNYGTGKTLLMQIFAEYLRMIKHDNQFRNISQTQLLNYYKMYGHIDKYTYNEGAATKEYEGVPMSLCLHDLGLMTENQKSFGVQMASVLDEFLFARYEIYQQSHCQKRCHLTTNLSVKQLKNGFEGRIVDRFKSYNVITIGGPSRRK